MRNSFSLCSLSLRHCLQNCSLFSLQDESDDEYCIGTSDCSSASGQHANIFSPVLSVSHNIARKSTTEVKIKYLNLSILSLDHIIRWYRLYTTDPCLQHCSWCSELGAAMSWAFYPAATIYIWNKSIISQPSRLLAAAPSGALQWWILWTVSPLRSLNSSTGIILQHYTPAYRSSIFISNFVN